MSERLPIQCSGHHVSDDFGKWGPERCALTAPQKRRFSDYGTGITIPRDGIEEPLIGKYSRGIVDLNREPGSPTLFPKQDFERPTPNDIWLPGQGLTEEERGEVMRDVYRPYHDDLMQRVKQFKRPGVVVAWDNTAHYEISNAATGEKEMMPPFILSNRGTRDSTDMTDMAELDARKESIRTTTCDPRFLTEFAIELRKSLKQYGLPDEVFFNRVYKGGYIGEHYNTRRHPELNVDQTVESFQIEYDTILTHDQETLKADPSAMEKLCIAAERALFNAYVNLLTWNVGVNTTTKE
ncbi:N-formylglutamate amidohydrolase [Candidatus Peregrinibacteria bacterium]|nr:N-formylglutamate amidohydrolase [Candidatus Peregrinibacteria bacterium]